MKRLIGYMLFLLLVTGAGGAQAQRLAVGEKAPDMKIRGWLGEKPASDGKYMFVEFFFSTSKQCVDNLDDMDDLAGKFRNVVFVVVTKEGAEKIGSIEALKKRAFHVALDEDGKTFAAYGVNYVPFGVLLDRKGKVLWQGNSTDVDEKLIKQYVR